MTSILIVDDDRLMRALFGDVTPPLGDDAISSAAALPPPPLSGTVEADGGRIRAENRAGGGVAVRFTLPIDEAPPKIQATDA